MDDLAFLDGAGALLRSFPNLRSALFAALCVMAQVRPSAYVDLRWDELDAALAEKRERELFRVVGTLQDRFGRLAFDRVEGDAGASGLLLWSTEHPALRDELPPPLSPPPPQPTWRTAAHCRSSFSPGGILGPVCAAYSDLPEDAPIGRRD